MAEEASVAAVVLAEVADLAEEEGAGALRPKVSSTTQANGTPPKKQSRNSFSTLHAGLC